MPEMISLAGNNSARGRKSNGVITPPVVNNGKGRKEIAAPLAPLDPPVPLEIASRQAKLMVLGDVTRTEVEWLVPNLVPLGSLTVIDGAKGEGKSALTYDLAACVTAAKPMPLSDGEPVGSGAILLQAEDDIGATVRASIEAAGGDLTKIRIYNNKAEPLRLDDPEDLAVVRQAAKDSDARLLVVDPFSEFFSKSLKDEKTIRNALRPLRDLAAELHMAVILVRHITKSGTSALYRGLGGVAVANSARAALVVGHDPSSEDPYRHVLALNRCNLPRDRDVSLAYRTVKRGDTIVIEWQGESRYSADDLVAAARSPDDHSQLEEACRVLYSILATADKPMPATEVYEAAKDALISVGTLKRAKKMLRVRSCRRSCQIVNDGKTTPALRWVWQLPDDEDLLRPYRKWLKKEQADEAPIASNNQAPASPT